MDSNAYSTLKPLVDGYGWFHFDQIAWYRKMSEKYTAENGGTPLPALMFFLYAEMTLGLRHTECDM